VNPSALKKSFQAPPEKLNAVETECPAHQPSIGVEEEVIWPGAVRLKTISQSMMIIDSARLIKAKFCSRLCYGCDI